MFFKFMAGVLVSLVAGCVENSPNTPGPTPPPLLTEPIGLQLTRAEPRLVGMPFRVLLDFEQETDLSFVTGEGYGISLAAAHTGRSSLAIGPGRSVTVKLTSLLSGAFPGSWSVAGGYFRPESKAARVKVSYRSAAATKPELQRTVELAAGRWTPVFVDLTELKQTTTSAGLLTFEADAGVHCDDVLLLNNNRTMVAPAAGAAPGSAWTIREGGFSTVIERAGHFRLALATPEAAPDGWRIVEANDLRARFESAGGKTWTIYFDGRQYRNGGFIGQTVLAEAAAIFERQHESPADLFVPETIGRIDRDTPGDKYNDGYNEQRGSYELIARGPRFEVTIKPKSPLLAYPVLEIAGLPAGNVLATVEGQLIEKTVRLGNGNLLVYVPATLERATTVNIAVK